MAVVVIVMITFQHQAEIAYVTETDLCGSLCCRISEVTTHGVCSEFLVHYVPLSHQRRHSWLLPLGDWRLGLVQSEVEH